MFRASTTPWVAALAAGLVVAAPASVGTAEAPAQDPAATMPLPSCRIDLTALPQPAAGPFQVPFQAEFGAAVNTGPDMRRALQQMLGPQFTEFWLKWSLGGWMVGVAPGPLDLGAATAAIADGIRARWAAGPAGVLIDHLHVDPQPYGAVELAAAQAEAQAILQRTAPEIGAAIGVGCAHSDAWRVEARLFNDSTAEQEATVRAALAPLGDKVRVARVDSSRPQPAAGAGPTDGPVVTPQPGPAVPQKAPAVQAPAQAEIPLRESLSVIDGRRVFRASRLGQCTVRACADLAIPYSSVALRGLVTVRPGGALVVRPGRLAARITGAFTRRDAKGHQERVTTPTSRAFAKAGDSGTWRLRVPQRLDGARRMTVTVNYPGVGDATFQVGLRPVGFGR